MKRTVLIFFIALLVLVSLTLWAVNADMSGNLQEILVTAGVLILVGFAVFIGIVRLRSYARKEPAEDELSRNIMTKASSLSFYISLYFWLVVMYYSDKTKLEAHSLIGAGIMGMAIIFLLCWLGVKLVGWKNE
jgi:peptidoglycan/LPS O-acetylase OafA/YrhL